MLQLYHIPKYEMTSLALFFLNIKHMYQLGEYCCFTMLSKPIDMACLYIILDLSLLKISSINIL